MTTSGVATFSISTSDLIYNSFYLAEIIAQGDVLDPDDYAVALSTLNMMVKSLQAQGYGLWLNQIVTLPLVYQQQSYLLGPTGANCSANMGETAIATAALSGATSITVDSAADIINGQYIGIQLDDSTMQWTTVNGVPVGNVVTLAAALTAAAAVDNVVFYYTTKINRPLEIIEARLRDKTGIETPLEIISLQEYKGGLSIKSSMGKPSQVTYDPQLVNGVFYVWETAQDVSDRIMMTVKRPVEDFVNTADTPDFPIEWSEALEACLGYRLGHKFRVPAQKKAELKELAKERLDEADWGDREKTYLYIVPCYE